MTVLLFGSTISPGYQRVSYPNIYLSMYSNKINIHTKINERIFFSHRIKEVEDEVGQQEGIHPEECSAASTSVVDTFHSEAPRELRCLGCISGIVQTLFHSSASIVPR